MLLDIQTWSHGGAPGDKDGVGTSYSPSRIWFTVWNGIITEVCYPTIDRPQVRDLQILVTDGETFFHDETRHLVTVARRISDHVLGYHISNSDLEGRYSIVKDVITDPHLPCVLQRANVTGEDDMVSRLRLYALCSPRLGVGGDGNNGHVVEAAGRQILVAEKDGVWLALAGTVPFSRLSCGYVGFSDGWQDLNANLTMDWEFDSATDGHIALVGELALAGATEFTLGLALGDSLHSAITTVLQALAVPFSDHMQEFVSQWDSYCAHMKALESASEDTGKLYHASASLLLAHEDKTFPGAFIASLSIPWGEARGDSDRGGYHLVWTRDMVNSASGLLAAGDVDTAGRALVYLAASQSPDGGFPQNFWIDGRPYWQGIQLDEVALPVLLAWRLNQEGVNSEFDYYPMVLRAAGYLVRHGPATQQERWEEAGGYSPSTLASNIAALICAACFARERDDTGTAIFLEEYADFLESHVESWTVTQQGSLLQDIKRHYIRIHPVRLDDSNPDEDPDHGLLVLANQPHGSRREYPARDIVDAGFLELVRYGIRMPGDPLIEDSLRVVDAVLKVDTPYGPCWRRYNHDGYGQREDGGPYQGWGRGRVWPLLSGERGHYELAAGRDVRPYVLAMEGFASVTGMLPEQIWDEPESSATGIPFGRPTGSAMPLMWAHAEYIKLLRSVHDRRVFDLIPAVADRYLRSHEHTDREIWKPNRHPRRVKAGAVLRIQAPDRFRLIYPLDEWRNVEKTAATWTELGIGYADIPLPREQRAPIRFTFYWDDRHEWEGHDYTVEVTLQP